VKAFFNPHAIWHRGKRPSYISKSTFSNATLDLVSKLGEAQQSDALTSLSSLEERVGAVAESPLKAALDVFVRQADNVEEVKEKLEGWFDETMERASGWYKRWTKIVVFAVGLLLSAALNADTINVARVLWTDDAVRAAVVAAAEKTGEAEDALEVTPKEAAEAVADLGELQVPLGWIGDRPADGTDVDATTEGQDPREIPGDFGGWVLKILGILITAAALTFGAPFWFDLLKRFVSLRSSGDPKRGGGGSPGNGTNGDETHGRDTNPSAAKASGTKRSRGARRAGAEGKA
jgi:hypothetical protein